MTDDNNNELIEESKPESSDDTGTFPTEEQESADMKTETEEIKKLEEKEHYELDYFSKEDLLKEKEDLEKNLADVKEKFENLQKDNADSKKKFMHLQAEFENYQRRVKKEIEYAIKGENEKLILKMITILDELEIALNAGRTAPSKEVMLEGLDIIIKKFKKMLVNEGLSVIEAVGKPFDPNFHEVIAQVQTNDFPEGIIVEEFKKGYILYGKVIRPSVVSIAKAWWYASVPIQLSV